MYPTHNILKAKKLRTVLWSLELNEKLINAYKRHECLYNVSSEGYYKRDMRVAAWSEISTELGVPVDEARDRVENLRTQFVRAKKEGPTESVTAAKLFILEHLKFLDCYIKGRGARSSSHNTLDETSAQQYDEADIKEDISDSFCDESRDVMDEDIDGSENEKSPDASSSSVTESSAPKRLISVSQPVIAPSQVRLERILVMPSNAVANPLPHPPVTIRQNLQRIAPKVLNAVTSPAQQPTVFVLERIPVQHPPVLASEGYSKQHAQPVTALSSNAVKSPVQQPSVISFEQIPVQHPPVGVSEGASVQIPSASAIKRLPAAPFEDHCETFAKYIAAEMRQCTNPAALNAFKSHVFMGIMQMNAPPQRTISSGRKIEL